MDLQFGGGGIRKGAPQGGVSFVKLQGHHGLQN